MADTRVILRNLNGATPTVLLISQIDQTFETIHERIIGAYQEGRQQQQLALFENFWQQINFRALEFATLQEINQYYANLEVNLEHTLRDFSTYYLNETNLVTDIAKRFFLQLTHMACAFAIRRFVFSQFQLADFSLGIVREIKTAKEACLLAEQKLHHHKPQFVKASLDELKTNLYQVTQQFFNKEYLQSMRELKLRVVHHTNPSEQLDTILEQLPEKNVLVRLTEVCNQTVNAKDNQQHAESKKQISLVLAQLLAVQNALNQFFDGKLSAFADLLKNSQKNVESINQHLQAISQQEQLQRVSLLLDLVFEKDNTHITPLGKNKLVQVGDALRAICKDQQPITSKVSLGLLPSKWNSAAEYIYQSVSEIALAAVIFLQEYSEHTSAVKPLLHRIQIMQSEFDQSMRCHFDMLESFREVSLVWETLQKILVETEIILKGHVLNLDDSLSQEIKKFLHDHWLKMTVGGLGAGGLSTALAILLTLHPASFVLVVVAGVTLGSSAGATAGVASDQCLIEKHHPTEIKKDKISYEVVYQFWKKESASAGSSPRILRLGF